jgi:uncharacterized protein YutE (UPF0331/DUF86 family)
MNNKLKDDDPFITRMMARLAQGFIREGVIDPTGKNDEQLYEEFREAVDKYIRDDFPYIIDHRSDVLQNARTFKSLKKNDLAILFYALWFEHQLNSITVSLAGRRHVNEKEIESLVRETSYRAKCSWLLRLLGVKPLNASHTNTICKLMELRNAFVHYKWKPKNEQIDREMETLLEEIEKTVKYVRGIENKHLYLSHRRRLHMVIGEKRPR